MKTRRGGPVKGITPFRKDKYAGGRRTGEAWIWWQPLFMASNDAVMTQENA
jgi:hypothetical protein